MKKDSIVRKQMLLYMTTVALFVMIFGASIAVIYTRHYMNEKRNMLISQGEKIAETYEEGARTGNLSNLGYEMQMLETYMGTGILFVDTDGVVVLTSPQYVDAFLDDDLIRADMLAGVMEGNVVSAQTQPGQFSDSATLLVGYPVSVGQVAGIFLCQPMPEIQASLMKMYQMSIVCLFFLSLLELLVCYLTVKYVTVPLAVMNQAAKVIANGDFEKRVAVKSNDELGELAESFNHMAESLEQQEKRKRDFIGNISHDLRSPLTSMQGFLTAMLDGTVPPEKQEKYLRIVLEETQRLSRMSESIVEMNRAQSSRILLEKTTFDLNEVIRANIALLEPQMTERNVRISAIYAGKETPVLADRDKISRVLQNLLGNAVKFSPQDGVIVVETTLGEKQKVLVSVKDEGPGLSAEDQKYVFDRFYKADSTRNKDKGGSGIGLAIAREFIQAHGETITVKSEEGHGCTFAFSLQRAE